MTEPVKIGDATLITADVIEGLRSLPTESVQCVVTSPPYWGLRDYGTATWEGGDPECAHETFKGKSRPELPNPPAGWAERDATPTGGNCPKCGAIRHDRMIGLEPTLQEWLDRMVAVCEEIKRVLRKDGTFWLNCGDAYANPSQPGGGDPTIEKRNLGGNGYHKKPLSGFKPKDLLMMPARLAIALHEAGWWVRSEIIWAKPNPMPESVTDRPASSHEKIYLLTKSAKYYYDADAVRETALCAGQDRGNYKPKVDETGYAVDDFLSKNHSYPSSRNLRNVWTIATQPYPEAHFATFPEALPMKCIMAGTSERGCCPECGTPWVRVVEKSRTFESGSGKSGNLPSGKNGPELQGGGETLDIRRGPCVNVETLGWKPQCYCGCGNQPVPCTVLDPFSGSARTGLVALKLNRRYIGIELNPEYVKLSIKQIQKEADQGRLF